MLTVEEVKEYKMMLQNEYISDSEIVNKVESFLYDWVFYGPFKADPTRENIKLINEVFKEDYRITDTLYRGMIVSKAEFENHKICDSEIASYSLKYETAAEFATLIEHLGLRSRRRTNSYCLVYKVNAVEAFDFYEFLSDVYAKTENEELAELLSNCLHDEAEILYPFKLNEATLIKQKFVGDDRFDFSDEELYLEELMKI